VIFPAFPRHFTGASKIKRLQTRVVNIMVLFGRRKIGAQFTGNFRSIVSPAGNEDPPAVGEPLRWNQRGRRAKSGSENDERRHKQRNGTTGRTIASPSRTRRQSKTLCLEKTTLRVRDYVQTVGLNAETKKDRHRAAGKNFVLTFPLIGVRPESRLNDCLAERIPTRPGLPWPVP